MFNITVFESAPTKTKIPYSPYGDDTFVFETVQVEKPQDLFRVLVSNFILNIPLKEGTVVRSYRKAQVLEEYYPETLNYIVLDIDKVKTKEQQDQIIQYFKNYKVILGESRSCNNIDNFRMKGFLFCEEFPISKIKNIISQIHVDLIDLCDVDECAGAKATLQAPIGKFKIIYEGDGDLYHFTENDKFFSDNFERAKTELNFNIEELQGIEADSIDKLCLRAFQSMGFEAIKTKNGAISFKHPSEIKSPGGYFWFKDSPYIMHHFNKSRSINIYDEIRKLPQAKSLLKKEINYDDRLLKFNPETNVISVNEKFLEVTPDIQNAINTFLYESDGLFTIRSPMGTGKSTIIGKIIKDAKEIDKRVLIITNRISVAEDFSKKYGLKLYNRDKYSIGDDLICQFDSLWKYDLKYFDLVILDEFISLLLHSRTAINNSISNVAKFYATFKKKLVIADAFLTGFENFILTDKTENCHLIDNEYRDPTLLYNYENFNYYIQVLLEKCKKGKVTISSTSLSFCYAVSLLLKKYGIRVVTLTADTSENTKEIVYKYFEESNHDKWDVLIFSPTLTVGVSNLNDVYYHFHYDSSITTDVISSIQMIKRTRKSKEIHLFLRNRENYVKTTFDEIRDDYLQNIGRSSENSFLFEINDYGETRLSKIGMKAIQIDTFRNILEYNHKNAFFWMMQYHFFNKPQEVTYTFESNILLPYIKQNKANQKLMEEQNLDQFLMLNDLEKRDLESSMENTNKVRALERISKVDDNIKSVLDCPELTPDIRKELIKLGLKDSSFIEKCRRYYFLSKYANGFISDTDVKNKISDCIMYKNEFSDITVFLSALLKYAENHAYNGSHNDLVQKKFLLRSRYKKDELDDKLQKLITDAGYKIYQDGSNIGERFYEPDRNVLEYYKYIKP